MTMAKRLLYSAKYVVINKIVPETNFFIYKHLINFAVSGKLCAEDV